MFSADKAAKFNETDEQQRIRFQVELEFVQCLANPNYLNRKLLCFACDLLLMKTDGLFCLFMLSPDLAQNGHFKNKSFINYINYLQYWKKPEYSKYLR